MLYSSFLSSNSTHNKSDISVGLKFKQKYLLIKGDNVVVTFVNQELKFHFGKIGRFFYKVVSFFK